MINIFAMDQAYREERNEKYTSEYLITFLELTSEEDQDSEKDFSIEYQEAYRNCKMLCPTTFGELPKDPKKRFEYLQFLYYMIMNNRKYSKEPFSIFDCLNLPPLKELLLSGASLEDLPLNPASQRCLTAYNDMIKEIRGKVSREARLATDGPYYDRNIESDEGWYDDSIHTIQYYIDLIAQTLACAYCFNPRSHRLFKIQEWLFYEWMSKIPTRDYCQPEIKSYWDELYYRLNYARCVFWEFDLLQSYDEVHSIIAKPLPEDSKGYYLMRSGRDKKITLEDNCFLVFKYNSENPESGEIIEWDKEDCPDFQTIKDEDIKYYYDALERYIGDSKSKIAEKVFCVEKATENQRRRIKKNFSRLKGYLEIGHIRYGQRDFPKKARLISAYQVIFLSLPKLGLAKPKSGTPLAIDSKREKNTLHSSYTAPGKKDPRYLQRISTWTNYQYIWNICGEYFSEKYLGINKVALAALLLLDYRDGMSNLQLHAEKIFLVTADTLISDEDGKEELENYRRKMSSSSKRFWQFNTTDRSLIVFGKLCKLTGRRGIVNLINKKTSAEHQRSSYAVDLAQIDEFPIHKHTLILNIDHDMGKDTYRLQSLKIKEIIG